jgi:hypothetical protein
LAPCVRQQRKSSADPLDQKRGAQRRRGWANGWTDGGNS